MSYIKGIGYNFRKINLDKKTTPFGGENKNEKTYVLLQQKLIVV